MQCRGHIIETQVDFISTEAQIDFTSFFLKVFTINIIKSYPVGAILVYDVTNSESLENLRLKWIPQLREFCTPGIRCIIVGNKADLVPAEDRANQTEAGISSLLSKRLFPTIDKATLLSSFSVCFRKEVSCRRGH
jgi:hypothetical protein